MTPPPFEPETLSEGAELFNYALRPYGRVDADGIWHVANILRESLERATVGRVGSQLCEASRRVFGTGRTAWGIKSEPGKDVSWEFYYYRHAQEGEPITLLTPRRVGGVLVEAGLNLPAGAADDRGFFSVSFDVSMDVLRQDRVAALHVYVDQGQCSPPAAMSYLADDSGMQFENIYFLCRQQPPDIDFATYFVFKSPHVDENVVDLSSVLWPELLACDHIALAHKASCDGVYFGGVTIDQFSAFAERSGFDPGTASFVLENRERFGPLRLDVGFDFVGGDGSSVRILKSAVYGYL